MFTQLGSDTDTKVILVFTSYLNIIVLQWEKKK